MEDRKLIDTSTPKQRAERKAYLDTAFKSVERKFQTRDFDGAVVEAGRLAELTPGEGAVLDRVELLSKLVPQFKAAFEEGMSRYDARTTAAAFIPLRFAHVLFREIGLVGGPLGPALDQALVEAAIASGREAMSRQDYATAGMRFRDATRVAPKDPRAIDGLEQAGKKASRILTDTYSLDRTRAPRLYVEKLELVRELSPKGSAEAQRAAEQLRIIDAGVAPWGR
jgi:hypothetical protein